MNTTKVALGLALLALSSAIMFATGAVADGAPLLFVAVAALGMATGTLLLGTTTEGRPV